MYFSTLLDLEFAHLHSHKQDRGSWHIYLSSKDAQEVVQKGWGELFPFSIPFIQTENLVLVYAPRNLVDAEVLRSILLAAYQNAKEEYIKR